VYTYELQTLVGAPLTYIHPRENSRDVCRWVDRGFLPRKAKLSGRLWSSEAELRASLRYELANTLATKRELHVEPLTSFGPSYAPKVRFSSNVGMGAPHCVE